MFGISAGIILASMRQDIQYSSQFCTRSHYTTSGVNTEQGVVGRDDQGRGGGEEGRAQVFLLGGVCFR